MQNEIILKIKANEGKCFTHLAEKRLNELLKDVAVAYEEDIKQNPHAELIAQCEQDKIDYPEFWFELWQWRNKCDNICEWKNIPYDADCLYEFNEYRRNPHAENIIAWRACSEEDKKRWEFSHDGIKGWLILGYNPEWHECYEYRLRPRTCKVTMQDGTVLEYPEPVRNSLNYGQEYFVADSLNSGVFVHAWRV